MSRSSPRRRTSHRRADGGDAGVGRPRLATIAALALWLAASGTLQAQEPAPEAAVPAAWRGSESLLVLVTDERGQAVPEVAVTLRRGDGPEALSGLLTDAEGRLEVTGLAPGEWQVDLSREGFMLFTAYLKLAAGEDPEVAFSSRQRTGSYWSPLQAAFLRAGDAATAAASAALRTGRASAKEARRSVEQQARQDRRAGERLERRVRRGDAARVIEQPAAVAEAPAAEPATPLEQPAEQPVERPTERPAATAAPTTPAATATPAPRPAPPAARPVAVAEPAPVAAAPAIAEHDAAPAARQPAAAPVLLPNPTLRQAGACVECQPGEWSVSSSGRAASGGPCPPSGDELVAAARRVAAGLPDAARRYAGALVAEDGNDALRLLAEDSSAPVRESLGTLASPASSCVVLGIVLPAGARYVGFRYEAGERGTTGDCPIGGTCQIGEASWRGQPVITQEAGVTVVHAVFENRSTRRERVPRLTVYFRPPAGWLPPTGGR